MMLGALASILLATSAAGVSSAEEQTLLIHAEVLYTGTGAELRGALLTLSGGKLTSMVGGAEAPEGALRVAAVTPGMIDMSARITRGLDSVEQSSEVTPHMRVADSLDLFDRAWDRQLRDGVTTVLISPPDRNVIGGLGVVLKTGGEPRLEARLVKADAVLRGAFGNEPSVGNRPASGRPTTVYSRRPTTRMGVEWEWRRAYFAAAQVGLNGDLAFPGHEVVQATLRGELPLFAQAWTTQDIRTAVFLTEEMKREGLGQIRLIVDSAAEAWKEPQLLVRSGTAVVLPPFTHSGRTGDGAFMAWDVASELVALGVPVALSSHGSADPEASLALQAAFAQRGGLSFQDALAAVTRVPAELLGIDQRVGTLAIGKDADMVLWNGTPFEITSKVIGVVLDGRLALDPRKE
jgi:imidazolonepropionase-like amidohydrolase